MDDQLHSDSWNGCGLTGRFPVAQTSADLSLGAGKHTSREIDPGCLVVINQVSGAFLSEVE